MVTITFKYTDYGHESTTEFREFVKNLIGYINTDTAIGLRFGKESDPMFDDKIVAQITIVDEDVAFDVVNHFMMEREVNSEATPFDVDVASVAIYVSGSDRIMDYLTSRSFANLYERLEVAENMISAIGEKHLKLRAEYDQMASFVQRMGADRFPEIIKEVVESMEAEGHSCKTKINQILERKVH